MGLLEKLFSAADKGEGLQKLDSAQDQTNDERELVSHIKRKVEESRSSGSRVTHEGIWMTNIAYLLGFDSVYYDTSTRQFKAVGRGTQYLRRNRIHVNKILPTVQNRLAKLCKNPPKYDVRPKSNEPTDKEAADLALKILTMVWDNQRINKKQLDLVMWAQQCGHAYIKVSFDEQLGKQLPTLDDGDLAYEGDIRVDVVSPFEMFPDPLAKTLDECQWIVQAKVRKLDYFKTHYPDRGHLVHEEDAWLLSAQYEARINQLNNQGPTTSGVTMALKNSAIEVSYYEKRSNKHPNGRLVVSANGVLLENKALPVGEIPFAKFDDILVGGKFYSESLITHLRPIQDQYNRTISRRAEWVNKLLAGKYIAAKGHGLIQEALNDQSGEVVEFDPIPNAPPPTALPIPNIPSYAYKEDEVLIGMMNDISGINEASRGQSPGASVPAIAMQLMVEQDDTRIGIITEGMEESWARVGSLILKYAQECYTAPRLLKVFGKNSEYVIKEFTGEDIKDNDDVIVVRGSTLPGSKVLKRQEVMNLYQMGAYGPPGDPKAINKMLEILEYGDVADTWKDVHLYEKKSKRSIEKLEQGELPEINEFDDNGFIFQKVNEYRLENEDTMSPELKPMVHFYMEGLLQSVIARANPGMMAPGPAPMGIQPNPPPPPMPMPGMPGMGAEPKLPPF